MPPSSRQAAELLRRSRGELPERVCAAADAFIARLQAMAPHRFAQGLAECHRGFRAAGTGGRFGRPRAFPGLWKGSKSVATDPDANYVYYGVREFAMTAISTRWRCWRLHPYDATFLVFGIN